MWMLLLYTIVKNNYFAACVIEERRRSAVAADECGGAAADDLSTADNVHAKERVIVKKMGGLRQVNDIGIVPGWWMQPLFAKQLLSECGCSDLPLSLVG